MPRIILAAVVMVVLAEPASAQGVDACKFLRTPQARSECVVDMRMRDDPAFRREEMAIAKANKNRKPAQTEQKCRMVRGNLVCN